MNKENQKLIYSINKNFDWLRENVIDKQICCGCGTCVGVCPTSAIDFIDNKYYPEWINKDKCINCGFCIEVCPGKGLPLNSITKELKTSEQKYNIDIGNYIRFLKGYSNDKFIKSKSASGGITTSLLIYALDKKLIDKVIVVVNDEIEIGKPIAIIANSKEDILMSIQSKYIQVPLNKLIKEILKSNYRYGIVGLPCHLEGLYLAQRIYKRLSEQIVFKIGLFCGYSYNYKCINTLIRKMGIKREEIDTFLGWREGDYYPGFFSIKLRNENIVKLSFIEEHNIDVPNYALFRCFLCIDGLNQLADISLGDSGYSTTKSNFIIVRTAIGDNLLKSAKSDGYINYYQVDSRIAISKGIIPFMLKEKRYKVLSVIYYLSQRGITVPRWDIKETKISIMDKINGIIRLKLIIFVRKSLISRFLESHPNLMERVGGFIYHFDINPRTFIFRIISKFLRSHPNLKSIIKNIYYRNFSLKYIFSIVLNKFKNKEISEKANIPKKLSIGLVGIGGWGKQYVNILSRNDIFNLTACFDINKEILNSICSSTKCLKAQSFEELLNIHGLDAVLIATPNHLHYEQCIKAIKHGKHIFIEKPITNTVDEAMKVYNAASGKNLVISVGHNMRRRAEVRSMKKIIENREIGDIIMIEANNSQPINAIDDWRLSKNKCPSGPLLQLGIHLIDTLMYLFGEIKWVKAFLRKEYFEEIPDTVLSLLSFESGIIGYLCSSWVTGPSFTIKVYGTDGVIFIDGDRLYLQKGKKKEQVKIRPINTLEDQIREFGESILYGKNPEVDIKEAIKNLIVVEAIIKSTQENGEIIKLEEI